MSIALGEEEVAILNSNNVGLSEDDLEGVRRLVMWIQGETCSGQEDS